MTPAMSKPRINVNKGNESDAAGASPPNGSKEIVTSRRLATAKATMMMASGTRMIAATILRSNVQTSVFRSAHSRVSGNPHGRFVISARPAGSPHLRGRADYSQYGRSGLAALIEPLAHFLAGLEERHAFLVDRHMRAGARIAPGACRALLHRKGAEPAQLDAIAARHSGDDLAEDGVDDLLDVALVEMGILRRNTLHKFGLDHCEPWTVPCTASWAMPWTLSRIDWVVRNQPRHKYRVV